MRLNLTGIFLIAATAFTSSALAQVGADSCGQATPITGSGTRTPDIQFGVTTLDGQMSSCGRLDTFGDPLGQADVWYRYTAVSTGALQIGAVANVANRGIGVSVLSGCNGTELYCASNVSRTGNGPLIFPIVAGGSYLVRVTTYASMAFGSDIQTTIGNFNGTPNTHTGLVFTELPSIAGQPGASCANPRQVTASAVRITLTMRRRP